ncbi:Ku protein [Streptomyces mirabilis]
MVPLTDEDLAHLPLPTKRTVDVLGFVPFEDIDPISYGRPYYVGSGPGADRPYSLLVEALARTGYVAVSKVALRGRERPALLRTSPRHAHPSDSPVAGRAARSRRPRTLDAGHRPGAGAGRGADPGTHRHRRRRGARRVRPRP